MTDILLINGPNLNMLGTREPEVYGSDSLSDIENSLKVLAKDNNITISFMQSNAEHEIINKIQEAKKDLVKILNRGELKTKINITAHKFSASAKAAIEALGGVCTEI